MHFGTARSLSQPVSTTMVSGLIHLSLTLLPLEHHFLQYEESSGGGMDQILDRGLCLVFVTKSHE